MNKRGSACFGATSKLLTPSPSTVPYTNWFKDNGHGAYPCTVQGSDDEVNLGSMRFGGDFADNGRMAEEFYQSYRGSQAVDGDIYGRLLVGFKLP